MAWEIEVTDEFREWWADLTTDQQAAVSVRVELLGQSGPSLGRPAVERIRTSRHHSMKELRSSEGGALRVLFMFDPRRQVILAATRAGNGTSGMSGLFRLPTSSTTATSTSCVRKA